ncbi:MAG: helix-turn-helix domain-containing protein [Proteobacteria bacterium]|nr:helix-turn-helix domain-containing protein [Pseudomonadota bacterium]
MDPTDATPPSKPNPELDAFLTPEDVERIYQIKRGTQGVLRARRQIPFLRLGGGKIIRYSRSELAAWAAVRSIAVGER